LRSSVGDVTNVFINGECFDAPRPESSKDTSLPEARRESSAVIHAATLIEMPAFIISVASNSQLLDRDNVDCGNVSKLLA
jgi:hypothetical protein